MRPQQPHGGFLHALPSLTPQNAAAHTSSALAHLRGAPHSASPPPHSCCPQSGQHGAARFSVIYRLRRLAFPQICTGSVLWRFAAHSCISGIEKATAHAEEGARRLTRQAPSRGVRPQQPRTAAFSMPCPLSPRETPLLTQAALWRTCAARRIRLRRRLIRAARKAGSTAPRGSP